MIYLPEYLIISQGRVAPPLKKDIRRKIEVKEKAEKPPFQEAN